MQLTKNLMRLGVFVAVLTFGHFSRAADRVTILYDAFGSSDKITKDWGFSALVEHDGKRILFDTGNDAKIFEHNVKALGVDLGKLDFVVISHRHGDHSTGLKYVLGVNPGVKVYVPNELAGLFGGFLPKTFYRDEESLPKRMRYFDGAHPEKLPTGYPWEGGNFVLVDKLTEVSPGIFLIPTISNAPGTLELRELTLAIKGERGLILVDGCSHAGVEEILKAASAVNPHVHILFGGLHLVRTSDQEVDRLAADLRNKWKLDRIAPGHCTGEPAFLRLQKVFGDDYLYAGAGTLLVVP